MVITIIIFVIMNNYISYETYAFLQIFFRKKRVRNAATFNLRSNLFLNKLISNKMGFQTINKNNNTLLKNTVISQQMCFKFIKKSHEKVFRLNITTAKLYKHW